MAMTGVSEMAIEGSDIGSQKPDISMNNLSFEQRKKILALQQAHDKKKMFKQATEREKELKEKEIELAKLKADDLVKQREIEYEKLKHEQRLVLDRQAQYVQLQIE